MTAQIIWQKLNTLLAHNLINNLHKLIMQQFIKLGIYCWVLSCVTMTVAQAEPYHLIAGSSTLGFRESDKQNVNIGFSAVFNEILSSENVKCDFKSTDSSEELYAAIQANQVNAFFGSPVEFLKTEQYFLDSPIASGIFANQLKYKNYLLVRKDSGIYSITQLKGKKLVTSKWTTGDLGGLYLETLLLENKQALPKQFFSEVLMTETSNRALVDLLFKKADATLVNENQFNIAAELNPQLRSNIKILSESEPYLIFVTALSKNTPTQEIRAIKNSLFTVHKTAKGRSVLNLLKIQGFQEVSSADLDNVRVLIAKNKRLKAEQNVR